MMDKINCDNAISSTVSDATWQYSQECPNSGCKAALYGTGCAVSEHVLCCKYTHTVNLLILHPWIVLAVSVRWSVHD